MTSSFAYAGRDFDFTGLQFNGARCYNPLVRSNSLPTEMRTISLDNLGRYVRAR
jgi:hypothetical protein